MVRQQNIEKYSSLMKIKFDSEPIYGDGDKKHRDKNKDIWR